MNPYEKTSYFSRFLDTDGDGTGSIDANVDASETPVDFKLVVPNNTTIFLQELIVAIRDDGEFVASGYGGISTLTNGITVWFKTDGSSELINRTPQRVIRSNGGWARIASFYTRAIEAPTDQMHVSRHIFHEPLELNSGGEYIVRINDDLTGLSQHTFRVHGLIRAS